MERPNGYTKPSTTGIAPQENIVLADMLNLQLGQIQCDVTDQLVNNDYEGDFFKEGDTVKVVAIDPNSIKVVVGAKDVVKPALDGLEFKSATLTIDKSIKYGFKINDLQRFEDAWNHEAASGAIAGRKMREAHNLEALELILKNKDIARFGSIASPIDLASGGADPAQTLFSLVNAMKSHLKANGALDSNAQYEYGSNKTTPIRATAGLFVAPEIYTALLNSQYRRVDDVTEDVIRAGKYEKFAGFILNECYELSMDSNIHVNIDVSDAPANTKIGFIVMGTKNTVTRAAKVLPPEKQRSISEFADLYYGWEIYGQMVAVPESCVVAIVKLPSHGFTVSKLGISGEATTLMEQYELQDPRRTNTPVNGRHPSYGSYGYDSVAGIENVGYPATEAFNAAEFATSTHVHEIEATSIDGTNPVADVETGAPIEPTEGD